MKNNLEKLARLIRYFILTSSTAAGSGHPTSSLSATDLMTALMFGGHFRFDLNNPNNLNNDRLIFSKGHASPLFYSLWAAADAITEAELLTMRKFGSRLEGHPTLAFPFTEAATGSLGQGLSIGVGMALNAKLEKLDYKTYVLLGDSEMAEGSVWEAIQIAAHYKLDNLVGILDVNRLGQRGETMYGHNVEAYAKRISAFGWQTIAVDGHNLEEIVGAFQKATSPGLATTLPRPGEGLGERSPMSQQGKPTIIIAKTLKGKGVPYFEDKDGWHGKPLTAEELKDVLSKFGEVDKSVRGEIATPSPQSSPARGEEATAYQLLPTSYKPGDKVATRKAYGSALVNIYPQFPSMVVLDAEVSNSTFAEMFKKAHPERFFEMYIAEQNMVGAALGFARRGKIPFVSTFAAFFTRAFDQIRMSQYSGGNIKFVGSHAGVSIGEDGASQMGLEDIAMFRTLLGSAVLYPSDAVSTEKLVEEAARYKGIVYIRTTRKDTPIIYQPPHPSSPSRGEEKEGVNHDFKIGGSCVLRSSSKDVVTVVAAGITLYEALAAHEELQKNGINIRVIDLYSVKPLDVETLKTAAEETGRIITIEDHFAEGGIGEAVNSAIAQMPNIKYQISNLTVRKMPRSGKPEELLDYEEISKNAIIKAVKKSLESYGS